MSPSPRGGGCTRSRLGSRARPCGVGRFFYTGPLLLHPVGDGLVVTLCRTARRALTTPSHLPQDPPHVPRVVTDASQGFDHFRHALQRPHVGRVAVFERPLPQLLLNEAQVRLIELREPARPPGTA